MKLWSWLSLFSLLISLWLAACGDVKSGTRSLRGPGGRGNSPMPGPGETIRVPSPPLLNVWFALAPGKDYSDAMKAIDANFDLGHFCAQWNGSLYANGEGLAQITAAPCTTPPTVMKDAFSLGVRRWPKAKAPAIAPPRGATVTHRYFYELFDLNEKEDVLGQFHADYIMEADKRKVEYVLDAFCTSGMGKCKPILNGEHRLINWKQD